MSLPMARTSEVIEQGIVAGQHLGAQLYVSRDGEVLIDRAFGQSRPGIAMTTDTINAWWSSTKPFVAVALAHVWERGLLDLDDRVARYIPEFAVKGKEPITIRQVLTHTGGFRSVIGLTWADSYEQAISKVCETPLEPRWVPGQTAGYHAFSGWYILAELVRRLDGRRIDQYLREMIFLPLEMNDCFLGMPSEAYRAYGDRIGFMFDTSNGRLKPAENGNSEQDAANVRPGANGRGPINQLARFYEKLTQDDPSPLLKRETLDAMITPQRVGSYDLSFKHVIDFGLGFILNSNKYGVETVPYGYGAHAGPHVFGHSGHQSSSAFCDPDNRLVVAWVCNGLPGDAEHQIRQRRINTAIYEDLE